MGSRSRIVVAVVALCPLAGCATYGDIRAKAPVKTETVKGEPSAVADCVLDGLELQFATGQVGGNTFRRSRHAQTVHIAAQLNGYFGPQNFQYDIAFVPAPDGITSVELRSISDVWGNPQASSRIWSIVHNCNQ